MVISNSNLKPKCKEKINGACRLHNLHCSYPKCEDLGKTYGGYVIEEPKWIELTIDEILEIGRELGKKCRLGGNPNIDLDYAKAVSDKLREKNT